MCIYNNLTKEYKSLQDFQELFLKLFANNRNLGVYFQSIAID